MFVTLCFVLGMNLARSCFLLNGDMLVLLVRVSTGPNIWGLPQKVIIKIKSGANPKILGHPQQCDSYRLEENDMIELFNAVLLTIQGALPCAATHDTRAKNLSYPGIFHPH